MFIYKEVKKHVDEVIGVKCDRCGKVADKDEMVKWNNFHHLEFKGAYGSELIGDLNKVELDLCESCLDGCLGAYWRRVGEIREPI